MFGNIEYLHLILKYRNPTCSNLKMRQSLLFIFTFFITIVSLGQTLIRRDNESTEMFVKRLKPNSMEIAYSIIETNIWDSTIAIIAFYGYDDTSDVTIDFNNISGHLYLLIGQSSYRDIEFGPITEDGGYPEIIDVFFCQC